MIKETDRNTINHLHYYSNQIMPPQQRDASNPHWKKEPTMIQTPTNNMRSHSSPWNTASMGNKPKQSRNSTGSNLLIGTSRLSMDSIANKHRRTTNPTAQITLTGTPHPRKRRKTNHDVNLGNNQAYYVPGKGVPGASDSANIDSDVIQVISDDEDLGFPVPSSSDTLDALDKPYLFKTKSRPSHSSIIDLDGMNATTSKQIGDASLYSIKDGEATRGLEKRMQLSSQECSSPIEDYTSEPSPPKKPGPPAGIVQEKIQLFEDVGPRLDLRMQQNGRGVKNNMKGKNPLAAPSAQRDPFATTLSFPNHLSGKKSSKTKNSTRSIPIGEWFLGLEHKGHEDGWYLEWEGEKMIFSHRRKPLQKYTFSVRSEIKSIEYADTLNYKPFLRLTTNRPLRKVPSRNTDNFRMGDLQSGQITVLFDQKHSEAYGTLLEWIKPLVDEKQTLRPIAVDSVFETIERQSELKVKDVYKKSSETSATQETRSLKRPAPPDDETLDESTPPAVEELGEGYSQYRNVSAYSSLPTPAMCTNQVTKDSSHVVLRRSTRHLASPLRKRTPSVDLDEVILCYPQGVPGAINITNSDYKRLDPGEFLNDTLIEFGLKLWLGRLEESDPELAKQVHVFNSFFYKKLNKKNVEEGYNSVRKWTAKFDIFSKKYIIIPINENVHWYLAIIYQPEHILLPPNVESPSTRTRRNVPHMIETVCEPSTPIVKFPSATSKSSLIASKSSTNTMEPHLKSPVVQPPTVAAQQVSSSPSEIEAYLHTPSSDPDTEVAQLSTIICTVTVTSAASSPASPDMTMDTSKDNMTIAPPSPLIDIEAENGRLQRMSRGGEASNISDYIRPAAPTQPPIDDVEMEASPISTSQEEVDMLSDDSKDLMHDLQSAVKPHNFYSSMSKKARGKQKADVVHINTSCMALDEDEDQDSENIDTLPSSETKTYIFTLDSLGSKHPQAIRQLTRYLKREAQDKMNIHLTSDPVGKQALVPVQPNYCDCGLYLLHFAETFMIDPVKYCEIIKTRKKKTPLALRQEDWNDTKTVDMRERLRRDIQILSSEWKRDRAAKEEAKKKEAAEGNGVVEILESSDDEVDIVETKPATPAKGGRGRSALTNKGKALRLR